MYVAAYDYFWIWINVETFENAKKLHITDSKSPRGCPQFAFFDVLAMLNLKCSVYNYINAFHAFKKKTD